MGSVNTKKKPPIRSIIGRVTLTLFGVFFSCLFFYLFFTSRNTKPKPNVKKYTPDDPNQLIDPVAALIGSGFDFCFGLLILVFVTFVLVIGGWLFGWLLDRNLDGDSTKLATNSVPTQKPQPDSNPIDAEISDLKKRIVELEKKRDDSADK